MRISWELLTQNIQCCERCALGTGCLQKVPGQGDPHAPLMLIGEGPGEQEDKQGLAFVGPAGQLLTRMLSAIHLPRDRVFICNVVKCRPPGNRTPTIDEIAACKPFLRAQVALIRPKIIVLLGSTAGRATLDEGYRVTRDHGKWVLRKGVWMMGTYHPSALLRDESLKRPAWDDFRSLRKKLREIQNPREE